MSDNKETDLQFWEFLFAIIPTKLFEFQFDTSTILEEGGGEGRGSKHTIGEKGKRVRERNMYISSSSSCSSTLILASTLSSDILAFAIFIPSNPKARRIEIKKVSKKGSRTQRGKKTVRRTYGAQLSRFYRLVYFG